MPPKKPIPTKSELSAQVITRKGADRIVAYIDSLGAMELAIKKSADFLKNWHPEAINSEDLQSTDPWIRANAERNKDTAMKQARSAKDYARLIVTAAISCQSLEIKRAKVEGGEAQPVDALTDDQVEKLAAYMRGEAAIIPIKEIAVKQRGDDDGEYF